MSSTSQQNAETAMPPRGGAVIRGFFKRPWLYAAIIGVLALTGLKICQSGSRAKALPRLAKLPTFALTDQTGASFGTEELAGKVWVASFIFTTCPSTCPKVSRANRTLQQTFADEGMDVHLVSVTVDPDTDTPEVLTRYGNQYQADSARWHFLTGERTTIFGLLVRGFQTAMGDKVADEAGVVDISHSTKLVLVDRDGWIRWYFDSDAEGLNALVNHAKNLLADAPEGQS